MINKLMVSLLVILIVLIITNPTNSDFKNFVSGNELVTIVKLDCGRTQYFGLFSTYESNTMLYGGSESHNKYIGIFKNFIKISP